MFAKKNYLCWDTWIPGNAGGVNFTPPLNPMFDVQIWQMIPHWKALVLCFWNLQEKLQICKNWIFYRKIQLYSKNVCKKKFVQKLYIFDKPLTMTFQICKNFCKILNNLNFNQEKLKMCKFLLTGCLQKICNFFRKTCAIRFCMSKAFQKAKYYQNLTSGSGSKQRFSL